MSLTNKENLFVIKNSGKFYSGSSYSTLNGNSHSWVKGLADAKKFDNEYQAGEKSLDTGGAVKGVLASYELQDR